MNNVGIGRRARAGALGAVLVVAATWATMIAGAYPPAVQALVSDVFQVTAGGAAAIVLVRAARRGDLLLGAGTAIVGWAAVIWCVTDTIWSLLDQVGPGAPGWLSLGYVLGTLGYALGMQRSAAADRSPTDGRGRAREITDIVLLAGAAAIVWWVVVWEQLSDSVSTVVSVGSTVSDALFGVAALLAWTRAPAARRRGTGLVLVAAGLLMVPDTVYYSQGTASWSPASLALLDLAWFAVSAALAGVVLVARGPVGADRSQAVLWADAAIPPIVALAVVGVAVVHPAADDPGTEVAVVGLVVALGVRLVLRFAEMLDLTARLGRSLEAVAHQADHDDLTGLLARAAFVRHAEQVMADRHADGRRLAALWIDLDAFKRVNDGLGHVAGDLVLRVIAARLRLAARPGDVVGRLGGDEFMVLRPVADDTVDAWADELRRRVSEPIDVDGVPLRVTCSIGLVVAEGRDEAMADLLIEGDLALYEAKHDGRDRVHRFSPSLHGVGPGRSQMAAHVQRCLTDGRVIVRYQPVVDLATGTVVGAEALARLPHPDGGGELDPGVFLPYVEAMGQLPALARAVLARACPDFAAHPELGWLAVNLTSDDLADPQLPDVLASELIGSGLAADRLLVEINERVVPEQHILAATRHITSMGIRLALDDFGSGWSSLAQLRDIALSMVKVDRGVVEAASGGADAPRSALLGAAVAIARALDVTVVAEGVETPHERDTVLRAGADLGQGFLWSPAIDLPGLLRHGRAHAVAADMP